MGCDIHLYIEKNVKGTWISCDRWRFDTENLIDYVKFEDSFNNGRNYILFSILADVRNSHNIKPIDQPRGIPNDCNNRIKQLSNYWGSSGHSHSWFLLSELKNPQLKRKFIYDSFSVTEEEYNNWNKKQYFYPNYYPLHINKNNKIKTISERKYLELKYKNIKNITYYIYCKRKIPYSYFLKSLISKLEMLNVKSNKIRIVFWFDS